MTFRWVKSDGARPQAMTGRPALSIATGPAPTRPVASGSSSTSHVVPFQRLTLIATLAAEPFCHTFQTTTGRPALSTAIETASAITPLDRPAGSVELPIASHTRACQRRACTPLTPVHATIGMPPPVVAKPGAAAAPRPSATPLVWSDRPRPLQADPFQCLNETPKVRYALSHATSGWPLTSMAIA